MIIVTGGAGFIGSNIVAALNGRGIDDVIIVDNLECPDKINNLSPCTIADYIDKGDFRDLIARNESFGKVEAVFHQGACSDTMATDGRYVMDNNFQYSKVLFAYCQSKKIPFIYASSASVYGSGKIFVVSSEFEAPLNVYGYSKLLFDQYVRRYLGKAESQIVGLRYFNVYGSNEQHKQKMASVAYHFFHQYQKERKLKLFKGSGGFEDGEQLRDFISVEDVIKVNLFFMDNREKSGLYNVGTGRAQSFNDVARTVVARLTNKSLGDGSLLKELISNGIIEYIPFPDSLLGKYQSYTQADITQLRSVGYEDRFLSVEEGVESYVDRMIGGID